MVKCPDNALDKEDYKAFYNYINEPKNMSDLYIYFLQYDNSKYEIGVDRVIMTAYKKQLDYENTPAYTEMFYKDHVWNSHQSTIYGLCKKKQRNKI